MTTQLPTSQLPALIRATLALYAQETLATTGDGTELPADILDLSRRAAFARSVRSWESALQCLGLRLELQRQRQVVAVDLAVPTAVARAAGQKRLSDIYRKAYARAPATRDLDPDGLERAVRSAVRDYVASRRLRLGSAGADDIAAARYEAEGALGTLGRVIRAVAVARQVSALEIQAITGASATTVRNIVTAGRTPALALIAAVLDSLGWTPVLVIGEARISCTWALGAVKPLVANKGAHRRASFLLSSSTKTP